MSYLDEWEQLSLNGDADGICEMMHEELEFSIDDRTTPGRPLDLQGGKAALCDYYAQVVPAMKHIVSGMSVRRDDVEVTRAGCTLIGGRDRDFLSTGGRVLLHPCRSNY